ncbi:MAG: ABC transporter ATP-binding protein [Treponemataceae bacterium]|nr:MAG: ABC transporter ATP-binding protein [Treponemataceae bacterium]
MELKKTESAFQAAPAAASGKIEGKIAIEMCGITKRFGNINANDDISLCVYENEILALLGENGAGKSTLMSILFGSYKADSGVIKIFGKEEDIKNPNDATALGIGMVHQHFKLIHNYTVAQNIILGSETVNALGLLDIKKANERILQLSRQYGLAVDPKAKIEDITVGMQQRVEILKTLYRNAKIIIFDEPTACLTPQEIDELINIIKNLQTEGKTVILITHKLKEIKALAKRCAVLRRGKMAGIVDVQNTSENEIAELMVGRAVKFAIDKKPCTKESHVALSLQNISVKDYRGRLAVKDFSLDVERGKITGLAGVDGNGQSELIFAITGMSPLVGGKIMLNGKDISRYSIKQRIEAGISHIPEDRQKHGVVGEFSIAENIVLKNFYKMPYTKHKILLNHQAITDSAKVLVQDYDIRSSGDADTKASSMSGGNQQKLIIAREISLGPDVLVVAQPTRGLDVGAIEYIHSRIIEERDKGKAVLLISFELDEIMNLCDKIAAISRGSLAGIFNEGEVTEREIGMMMAGEKR